MSVDASRIVEVLADLAGTDRGPSITSVDTDLMQWLPLSYTNLLVGKSGIRPVSEDADFVDPIATDDTTQRIMKTARLRSADDDDDVLRVGWLWLVGDHPQRGQIMTPLVSLPVKRSMRDRIGGRIVKMFGVDNTMIDVVATGEPELTDLVENEELRRDLGVYVDVDPAWAEVAEAHASLDDEHGVALRTWAAEAAAAAGCPTRAVVAADRSPAALRRSDQLLVVAGVALYVAPRELQRSVTTASTLQSWAAQNVNDTALAALYADESAVPSADGSPPPGESPFELNAAQRGAVAAVGRQRLTVLSGPPGTGKTQTVAAVAFDQVRRGRNVLVVAPTNASVTALTTLMEQTPGPDPVVFGASTHRFEVASQLTERASTFREADFLNRRTDAYERVRDDVARRRRAIEVLLATEAAAALDPAEVMLSRAEAPGLFESGADLSAAHELARSAMDFEDPGSSWWRRRRARRALARLRTVCRASETESLATLARHVRLAEAQRRHADLEMSGGLDLSPLWASLLDATDSLRHASGALLEAATQQRDRADRSSQRAVAAVAAALRSGRQRRRDLLAEVDAAELLEPLPLWVSTLRDVDDLLPMQAGMFDLVIIDEASHIDQVSAAPALLRAKSALVVGDPRQLRHVSFVSGDRIAAAIAAHGLSGQEVAAQLDVQRRSLFDAAASVQPPLLLDEHYRSAPHLIDFSAQRFYDGRLGVATRHPNNEREDCIEVVEVDGTRSAAGVNDDEIETVVELLRHDLEEGRDSVGVITPFRAQADAMEAALRDAFDLAEIDRLNLRVGTVHGFQGCQREVMYMSMCLDDEAAAGSRSFVDDPALFNVMVTRARRSVIVVTSAREHPARLLAEYIRHGDLAGRQASSTTDWAARSAIWPRRVVAELCAAGVTVQTGYLVGRHEIDAVVGRGDAALGLVCGVHPDGLDEHIDRHLELSRLGWTVREVFASRWLDQLPALAVDLRSSHG